MIKNSKINFYERQSGDEVILDAPSSSPRLQLAEAIPLATPLTVMIFPIYACNLRCEFCTFAFDEIKSGYPSDIKVMSYDTYCKAIDGLNEFPHKLKLLNICGFGEPLLHPNIDQLVSYAVNSGSIERVEMVTNATLLTQELSDKLIDAGLTKLRVSIYGYGDDDYEKFAKRRINFDNFVENLEYYYKRRGSSKLYVKIMDYMVEDEGAAERFIDRFEPISDALQIEHLIPSFKGVDYDQCVRGKVFNTRLAGGKFLENVSVCAAPFYMLHVYPDGKISPCYSFDFPKHKFLGNIHEESMYSIWNGKKLYDFCMKMLVGKSSGASGICNCILFKFCMQYSDILDGHEEDLKQRLTKAFYS
jgi:radical SAM protein with 4Fe4S-binding SPASM domain